jgi:hypothetical protein
VLFPFLTKGKIMGMGRFGGLLATAGVAAMSVCAVAFADDLSQATAPQAAWAEPTALERIYQSDGKATDIVNLYIHGSIDTVETAFTSTGWIRPFPRNLGTDIAYGLSVVLDVAPASIDWASREAQKLVDDAFKLSESNIRGIPDPIKYIIQRMPVSPQYLNGKSAMFAFEMNNNPVAGRDHFRVYALTEKDSEGRQVWAVSAARDSKIVFDIRHPESFFMNHVPEADEDFERDFVLQSLQSSNVVEKVTKLHLQPSNVTAVNGAYSGDDDVYDVVLAN